MKRTLISVLLALMPLCLQSQNLSVSTNLADYAMLGTVNAGASVSVARHWTVDASVKYNPFKYGSGNEVKQYRQRLVSAGARWWPWYVYSGWWISGKAQYQEFTKGGFVSEETSEGDRYGGNITAGYSYMVGKHLNMEFGLGMWGGYEKYTTYACPHCGAIVDEGEKYFILPSDIIVSLSYIF